MPAKKVSRVIDVQKNNQLKYNFTAVPEADSRACFNRATWNPALNLQQPPLGTSHLILGGATPPMGSSKVPERRLQRCRRRKCHV